MEECDLVRLVQNGDMEAFEELFERYKAQALRTAFFITNNIFSSEDIVQETFIKCWNSIGSLKKPEFFKSWFFKILTRTSWKYSVRDKKDVLVQDIFEKADAQSIDEAVNLFVITEQNKVLHREIESLDIKQKTVIILYYFNGFSVKEIAKITGCFEGTVKSRLHNGRKTLKNRLTASGDYNSFKKEGDRGEVFKLI